MTQIKVASRRCSVARFAGLGSLGDVIPGLRSLRSLTRGYYIPPLRGWLSQILLDPLNWMAGPRRYRSGFCTEMLVHFGALSNGVSRGCY